MADKISPGSLKFNREIKIEDGQAFPRTDFGSIKYTLAPGTPGGHPLNSSAVLALYVIGQAWQAGVSFEDLADGYGPGAGTQGDWSAIRDSSDAATERMLERALNFMTFRGFDRHGR